MGAVGINFSLSVPFTPWSKKDCVQEIKGTIPDTGTITVLKVQTGEAVNREYPLFDVFNSQSEVLAAIYNAIFNSHGQTHDELSVQGGWDDMLVLWDFDINPEFRKTDIVVQAFETAITTFGGQSIIAAVAKTPDSKYTGLDLSVEEWRQLGFVKIGGTPFVYRDNLALNPYHDKDE